MDSDKNNTGQSGLSPAKTILRLISAILALSLIVLCIIWFRQASVGTSYTNIFDSPDRSDWLAVTGTDTIDVREFTFRYESSPFVGSGFKAKSDFLKALIIERILAQNGRETRVDTVAQVAVMLRQVSEEVAVENLLECEFEKDIKITENELRADFIKLLRDLTLEAWSFIDSAQAFLSAQKAKGEFDFSELSTPSINSDSIVFLTDLQLKYGSANKNLEDIAYSLQPGQISEPVYSNGSWWVLKSVRFEQKTVPSESAFQTHSAGLRKVIERRKRAALQREYITGVMKNRRMNLDPEGFNWLVDHLRSMLPDGVANQELGPRLMVQPYELLFPDNIYPDVRENRLDLPLLHLTGGGKPIAWSRREVLERLYAMPRPLEKLEGDAFLKEIHSTLIWLAEFAVLAENASREEILSDPRAKREWDIWTNHVLAVHSWREIAGSLDEAVRHGDNYNPYLSGDTALAGKTDELFIDWLKCEAEQRGVRFNLDRLRELELVEVPVILRKTHFPNRPESPLPTGYRWALMDHFTWNDPLE